MSGGARGVVPCTHLVITQTRQNDPNPVRAVRKEVQNYHLNPTQMFFNMDEVSLQK